MCGKCAEHAPRFSWIIDIWIFGRMEMVDMAVLRIWFFKNDKCEHFLKMSNFSYLRSWGHPTKAFLDGHSNPGRSEHVPNMFGTRCSEHIRNMEHLEPCSLPTKIIVHHCGINGKSNYLQ